MHETLHTLGAVQDGAPHATGLGHCFDWADVMCYDDGGLTAPRPWPGPSCGGTLRIDCGRDDYFSPRPARGSYLARRWNLFDSAFLCTLKSCDRPDADASARTALAGALNHLTRRLNRAGVAGLFRRKSLRARFRAPRKGRLGLTIVVGRRTLLAGHRTVARAGHTTVNARLRAPAGRLARAARLRIAVRLSFASGGRGQMVRATTVLLRRP